MSLKPQNPHSLLKDKKNDMLSKQDKVELSFLPKGFIRGTREEHSNFRNFVSQIKNLSVVPDKPGQGLRNAVDVMASIDIDLLLRISAGKIMEYTPELKEFSGIVDESINLVSCLIQQGYNFDNSQKSPFEILFNIDAEEFLIDFWEKIRDQIFLFFEYIIIETWKTVLLELIPYISFDAINKCRMPCRENVNPYQFFFEKVVVKTGNASLNFAKNKLNQININKREFIPDDEIKQLIREGRLDPEKSKEFSDFVDYKNAKVTEEELQHFVEKTLKQLPPEEISCFINGIFTKDVLDKIQEWFKDLYSGDDSQDKIIEIFEDINAIIDLEPVNVVIPEDCNTSVEQFERARLSAEGKTTEEINQYIQNKIEDYKIRLTNIANIFDKIPKYINQTAPSADITKNVLNKSLDAIFDSLGTNYLQFIIGVLKSILQNPTGEACIAFYKSQAGNTESLNIETIEDYIKKQLSDTLDFMSFDILDFNSSTFYEKYSNELGNYNPNTSMKFEYSNSEIIVYLNDKMIMKINSNQYIIYFEDLPEIKIDYAINSSIQEFTQLNSITTGFDNILKLNNNSVFENYYSNINESFVMNQLYLRFINYIKLDIGKRFFFGEFNGNQGKEKKRFINIDFYDLQKEKLKIKLELNI